MDKFTEYDDVGYYEDYKDESTHTCATCGKEYTWKWTTKHVGLCFTCKHWHNWRARSLNNPLNTFVVKGTAFTNVPLEEGQTRGGGHGGSLFTIKCFDGRTVLSRNLWCQGDISDHYRTYLPDNAEFVWKGQHRCELETHSQ